MTATVYVDPAALFLRMAPPLRPQRVRLLDLHRLHQLPRLLQVGSGRRSKNITGHRLAVIARDGSIPDGMTVDHICHNSAVCTDGDVCIHRRCVNPSHLEVTTPQANTGRRWRDRAA